MPDQDDKIIICSAEAIYHSARAQAEALDLMLLAAQSGPARKRAEAYADAVRPHVEAILKAAKAELDRD